MELTLNGVKVSLAGPMRFVASQGFVKLDTMLAKPEKSLDPQHEQQLGWILAMAGGDQEALGKLYDATLGKVYGLALRITGKAESAEEVVSDVYLQAYREAARFDAQRES